MQFRNRDGRVFDDPMAEWSPGPLTRVGDVAWFEEDILLVVEVNGGQAETVDHPKAAEMMRAILGPEAGGEIKGRIEEAMRIHWRFVVDLLRRGLASLSAESNT